MKSRNWMQEDADREAAAIAKANEEMYEHNRKTDEAELIFTSYLEAQPCTPPDEDCD
jgi:hypothetical protein